jgi:hypothetical protein
MKILFMLICVVLSSNAFSECVTNARGMTECNNGQAAGGYNANTGNAWKGSKESERRDDDANKQGRRGQDEERQGCLQEPEWKDMLSQRQQSGLQLKIENGMRMWSGSSQRTRLQMTWEPSAQTACRSGNFARTAAAARVIV